MCNRPTKYTGQGPTKDSGRYKSCYPQPTLRNISRAGPNECRILSQDHCRTPPQTMNLEDTNLKSVRVLGAAGFVLIEAFRVESCHTRHAHFGEVAAVAFTAQPLHRHIRGLRCGKILRLWELATARSMRYLTYSELSPAQRQTAETSTTQSADMTVNILITLFRC